MTYSFRLTREDFIQFHKVVARRLTRIGNASSKLLLANLIAWLPLGLALATCWAMYRKYPEASHDLNVVFGSVAAAAVLLIASFLYRRTLYWRAVLHDDGWFLAEQTVEADERGLTIQAAHSRSTYEWDAFVDRAEDESNLYLFIDNASALIVPKAAIGPVEEVSRFRAWSGIPKS